MSKGLTHDELLALPAVMRLAEAAPALRIGRDKARLLNQQGKFPVKVLDSGGRPVVTRHHLFAYLGLDAEGNPLPEQETAQGAA